MIAGPSVVSELYGPAFPATFSSTFSHRDRCLFGFFHLVYISLSLFFVSPYSHLNIVVISLSPFRLTSLCASPTSVFLVYSMQGQLFRPRDLRGLPKGAADRR